MGQRGSLRALAGICEFHKSFFLEVVSKWKFSWDVHINFSRLFKTSSSPSATASKQAMQNIVMATVEFYVCNTE